MPADLNVIILSQICIYLNMTNTQCFVTNTQCFVTNTKKLF